MLNLSTDISYYVRAYLIARNTKYDIIDTIYNEPTLVSTSPTIGPVFSRIVIIESTPYSFLVSTGIESMGNLGIVDYGILWASKKNLIVGQEDISYLSKGPLSNENSFEYKIEYLNPSTMYSIRPYAITNIDNDTIYGNELSTFTRQVAYPSFNSISIIDRTDTTITILASIYNIGSLGIDDHGIIWYNKSSAIVNRDTLSRGALAESTSFKYQITNLEPKYQLSYRSIYR